MNTPASTSKPTPKPTQAEHIRRVADMPQIIAELDALKATRAHGIAVWAAEMSR